jgi:curli production assembly/transport component CsgG
MVSGNVGLNYGEHNLNFSDNIDYKEETRDDYYYRFDWYNVF